MDEPIEVPGVDITSEITDGAGKIRIGADANDGKNDFEPIEVDEDEDEVEVIDEDEDISGADKPRDEDNEGDSSSLNDASGDIDYSKYEDPHDLEINGESNSSIESDEELQFEPNIDTPGQPTDETSSCSYNSENTNELESQDSQEDTSSKNRYTKRTTQSIPYNFKLLTQELTNGQSKFMENFDPERSNREKRKLTRKISTKKATLYDETGLMGIAQLDICDCMSEECPGCHFPCPKCFSNKCGHECRQNRRWLYEEINIEGTDLVIRNSAYYSVATEPK